MAADRLSTGVPGLDERLGGGLLPGTLTVVVGATGIGKTQLGLQFAESGVRQEGKGGLILDLSARGDSQSHAEYARRMFGWTLAEMLHENRRDLTRFFDQSVSQADYLHAFTEHGRRVTRRDLEPDAWREWQAELNRGLETTIAFLYGGFVRGARRVVVDGAEPVERAGESIQLELFEYVYHQIVRKDPEWVARDLFRQDYRRNSDEVARHVYDPATVGCMLLCTSSETMLDDLIERGIDEGDALTNANTLIYLGKVRSPRGLDRALYIAKHRGSACADEIVPFRIDERGLRID